MPQVLAQTPKWLVISKPPGWLSIPGRDPGAAGVLSEWASAQFGKVWVVHRLDRETSGLILFARTAEAHREAGIWFQKHQVKKFYDCLASGIPAAPVLKIQHPIEGSPSTTQAEIRESFAEGFLARVRLVTGRRHQIRIHLSKEGFPLWGDAQYGGAPSVVLGDHELKVGRVALHSSRLELPSGEKFDAPWPEDFAGWVQALREGGKKT